MSAALRTAARGWLGDEDKATLVPPSATLDENPVTAGSKRAACRRPVSRGGVEKYVSLLTGAVGYHSVCIRTVGLVLRELLPSFPALGRPVTPLGAVHGLDPWVRD